MKKIFLYFIIVINFIFFSNISTAKVVADKIIIGTAISLTGNKTTESLFFKKKKVFFIDIISRFYKLK